MSDWAIVEKDEEYLKGSYKDHDIIIILVDPGEFYISVWSPGRAPLYDGWYNCEAMRQAIDEALTAI